MCESFASHESFAIHESSASHESIATHESIAYEFIRTCRTLNVQLVRELQLIDSYEFSRTLNVRHVRMNSYAVSECERG